jgi:hypothetical protein
VKDVLKGAASECAECWGAFGVVQRGQARRRGRLECCGVVDLEGATQ